MEIGINKKKIVSAIQKGLSDTQIVMSTSNTITYTRKYMEKWDRIHTSINNCFCDDERFSIIPLDRGLFTPIMIFDNMEQVLYTIMRRDNFNKKLNRKYLTKAHYIDAMLDYNYPFQKSPEQLSMFNEEDMFSEKAKKEINDLHIIIENLLDTDKIRKYITIVVDFNGYILTSVEAILCSKWLEIIEKENWNEYIVPSFDDIEDNGKENYVHENELKSKIILKPTIKKKLKNKLNKEE